MMMACAAAAWAGAPQPFSDDLTLDWDGIRSSWLDKGIDFRIGYVSENQEMLESMSMEAFADRARRELRATGEIARRRHRVAGNAELTAHEAQIAQLARDGMSNPEIGARLFLSPRTVQYHLGNVFTKLGISSRSQLDRVLPEGSAV